MCVDASTTEMPFSLRTSPRERALDHVQLSACRVAIGRHQAIAALVAFRPGVYEHERGRVPRSAHVDPGARVAELLLQLLDRWIEDEIVAERARRKPMLERRRRLAARADIRPGPQCRDNIGRRRRSIEIPVRFDARLELSPTLASTPASGDILRDRIGSD